MATIINADTSDGLKLTSDTSGEIELQSAGVTKAKVTVNGLQDANGNPLRGGMYRNLIINGDMNIAQRATSKTGITTGGYYTVDRWNMVNDSNGTWTQTQSTDTPEGFGSSVKLDCTTANASLGASAGLQLQTRLEGQNLQQLKKGTANAESVTISFWVKSNKTGTYIFELFDADNTRQVSNSYTISVADTWEKKTITVTGDTTGAFSNDNGLSLYVSFWLGVGSDKSSGTLNTSWAANVNANRAVGQVNLADSTSNYINITGVQLEVGEGASDFEVLPYDVQLRRCQRYFEKSYSDGTAIGTASVNGRQGVAGAQGQTSTSAVGSYIYMRVQKRTTPTITTYDSVGASGKIDRPAFGAANSTGHTSNVYETNDRGFIGYSASGTAAHCVGIHYTANSEL